MLGRDSAIIETSRLTLRPIQLGDADELVGVLDDPALHEFTGGVPASLDELRQRFAAWLQGSGSADELWLNWIVCRTEDGSAIGTVQATVMYPTTTGAAEAFVAWTTGTHWQGKGYAGEAATALVGWLLDGGVRSITAHIHADHIASAHVATRAGLRRTSELADGEVVWRADQSV